MIARYTIKNNVIIPGFQRGVLSNLCVWFCLKFRKIYPSLYHCVIVIDINKPKLESNLTEHSNWAILLESYQYTRYIYYLSLVYHNDIRKLSIEKIYTYF